MADKQIKMADLKFVDFTLMMAPVKKEKRLWLPVTTFPKKMCHCSLMDEPSSTQFSGGFLSVHNKEGLLFSDQHIFLHDKHKARNFNTFNSQKDLKRLREMLAP